MQDVTALPDPLAQRVLAPEPIRLPDGTVVTLRGEPEVAEARGGAFARRVVIALVGGEEVGRLTLWIVRSSLLDAAAATAPTFV